MPAQPITKIKWNGNYIFGNEVLTGRPQFGSLVASVIAGWSIIEAHLGRTYAEMIGASQPVALSTYMALRSFDLQREMLTIAANETLPKRYAEIFVAALIVLNRASAHRHHFAHWIWGSSADPELEALLLVEPKHFWKLYAAQHKYWRNRRGKTAIEKVGPIAFAEGVPRLSHEYIWAYRYDDLREAFDDNERSYQIARALHELVRSKNPRRLVIYHWLKSEDDIHLALMKAKSALRPKTKPRPQRPKKSHQKLQDRK